jgi:transcription antitermination factor NusB
MSSRQKARELALNLLYQIESSADTPQGVAERFYTQESCDRDEKLYSTILAFGVIAHQETIDGYISAVSQHWRFERLADLDRNVIRLGLYELLYAEDIPPRVAINEAVNLAKKFGSSPKSYAFVNGILDAIYQAHRDQIDPSKTA